MGKTVVSNTAIKDMSVAAFIKAALAEDKNKQNKTTATAAVASSPATRPASSLPPSRAGRVVISGYFAPEVQVMLKLLAVEKRSSVQAQLAEALNMLFARNGKPEIAKMKVSA